MDSHRDDGRGHWPKGKRRQDVDPCRVHDTIGRIVVLLEASHKRGLVSRHAIAEHVGVDVKTVCRWLSGKHFPDGRKLTLLECWLKDTEKHLRNDQ